MTTNNRLAGLGLLALVLGSCEELPLQPTGLSDQLVLYAVLNADSIGHVVDVAPVDGFTTHALANVSVRIHRRDPGSGGWTLVVEWDSARAAAAGTRFAGDSCIRRDRDYEWPGSLGPRIVYATGVRRAWYCLRPEAVLEPGATYRVEAAAGGRVRAFGETRVVGDFEIERAAISSSDGSHSLAATWSESAAAHRYLMGVRRRFDDCPNCGRAWYAEVQGTRFNGQVPQVAVDSAAPVPMLDVLAVDRHFHAFLTTGDQGNLHDVHPVQNVNGGYGVVGSYLHRSREIETGTSAAGPSADQIGGFNRRAGGPSGS